MTHALVATFEERYSQPGMAVPPAIKDLRLALAEAERAAVPMPAASLVHDRLVGMVAGRRAELHWSASACSRLSMRASTKVAEDLTKPEPAAAPRTK